MSATWALVLGSALCAGFAACGAIARELPRPRRWIVFAVSVPLGVAVALAAGSARRWAADDDGNARAASKRIADRYADLLGSHVEERTAR